MANEKLSVAEALQRAETIDCTLDAWELTAPDTIRELGGRDALARQSDMSCVGPVPRLDADTWERASREYEERRQQHASTRH